MMFRSVTKVEKQEIQKYYGVSSPLRLRTTPPAAPTTNNNSTPDLQQGARGFVLKLAKIVFGVRCQQ
jgi:hypothetical protein